MEGLAAQEGHLSLPRGVRATRATSTLLSKKMLGPSAPTGSRGHKTRLRPKMTDRLRANTSPSSGAVFQVCVLHGTHTLQFSVLWAEVQNFLIEIKPKRVKGHSSRLISILISELPMGFR